MTILETHDFAQVFQTQKHNRVFQAKIATEREKMYIWDSAPFTLLPRPWFSWDVHVHFVHIFYFGLCDSITQGTSKKAALLMLSLVHSVRAFILLCMEQLGWPLAPLGLLYCLATSMHLSRCMRFGCIKMP